MHFSRQADIFIVHLPRLSRRDCEISRRISKTEDPRNWPMMNSHVDGRIMLVSLLELKSQSKDVKRDQILRQTSVLMEEGPLGKAGSFIKYNGSPSGSLWILRALRYP